MKHRPPTFPFRRRCGWCGVQLRLWQANLCRLCAHKVHTPDFPQSPPCPQGSRWLADPDGMGPFRTVTWPVLAVVAALAFTAGLITWKALT